MSQTINILQRKPCAYPHFWYEGKIITLESDCTAALTPELHLPSLANPFIPTMLGGTLYKGTITVPTSPPLNSSGQN